MLFSSVQLLSWFHQFRERRIFGNALYGMNNPIRPMENMYCLVQDFTQMHVLNCTTPPIARITHWFRLLLEEAGVANLQKPRCEINYNLIRERLRPSPKQCFVGGFTSATDGARANHCMDSNAGAVNSPANRCLHPSTTSHYFIVYNRTIYTRMTPV